LQATIPWLYGIPTLFVSWTTAAISIGCINKKGGA
jgi:hypothetical protein